MVPLAILPVNPEKISGANIDCQNCPTSNQDQHTFIHPAPSITVYGLPRKRNDFKQDGSLKLRLYFDQSPHIWQQVFFLKGNLGGILWSIIPLSIFLATSSDSKKLGFH